jgi:hypothetical protein
MFVNINNSNKSKNACKRANVCARPLSANSMIRNRKNKKQTCTQTCKHTNKQICERKKLIISYTHTKTIKTTTTNKKMKTYKQTNKKEN